MRVVLQRTLLVLAAIALALGALAGVANRQILDGDRFAKHADAIRMDDDVSRLIGQRISDRIIEANENLVAIRPLLEASTVSLVRSPAFSPIVEATARQLQQSLTEPNSKQVVLRIADFAAVAIAALQAVAPDLASSVPPDLEVTLAEIGAQDFAGSTLRLARVVGVLSWLLPLLALAMLAAALWLSRRRARTLAVCGLSIAAAGAIVALIGVVGAEAASHADRAAMDGALLHAGWREFSGPVWRTAAVLGVCGVVLFAAAGSIVPQLSLRDVARRAAAWCRDAGSSPRRQAGLAVLLIIAGGLAVFATATAIRIAVVAVGLGALTEGIGRLSRLAGVRLAQEGAAPARRGRRARAAVLAAGAFVGLGALLSYLIVAALPADRQVHLARAAGSSAEPGGCNGFAALCDRPYDKVAYAATHNAMSVADQPGWFIPEQPTGPVGQLDAGVRTLLIDTWYGQPTDRPGVIATTGPNREEGIADAKATYGDEVVDSALRLRSALDLTPTGSAQPYLCHQMCELGSTLWLPAMQGIRGWLDAHPREVVTFMIEDSVSPADTQTIFEQSGILPMVHVQQPGQPWPTLGQMIDSGQRVVVFMQRQGGIAEYPWLLKAWDWIQDTPYDSPNQAALSCTLNRGSASDTLLLINNIINRFATRVSDSERINAYSTLMPYVQRCQQERGTLPNFVAVDYYDKGDVLRVVNELNGVG